MSKQMKPLAKVKKISLKKAKSQVRDEKNLANVKKAISKEKDLMYKYPKGCITLPDRKKFRTDSRRFLASYLKKIGNLKGTEKVELIKEAKSWASKTYEDRAMPKF